jgi:hypothetical protein
MGHLLFGVLSPSNTASRQKEGGTLREGEIFLPSYRTGYFANYKVEPRTLVENAANQSRLFSRF